MRREGTDPRTTALITGATSGIVTEHRDWRLLYTIGGVVAFVALGGMLVDIALTLMPGWGIDTVPTEAAAWFSQFADEPLLGVRNLDLLNAVLAVVVIPMYVALFGAQRRTSPGLALCGLVTVVVGMTLFVSANAALPMLGLSDRYAATGDPATRAALLAATEALLARGAHGSVGALPGFILSTLGTLLISLAMLRRGVFARRVAWTGVLGTTLLLVYTVASTYGDAGGALVMAAAVPGGLLMIAWHAMVGVRLLRAGRLVAAAASHGNRGAGTNHPSRAAAASRNRVPAVIARNDPLGWLDALGPR